MEYLNERQIAEAVVESRRLGETPAELDARIDSMIRWSDEDLAKVGVKIHEQAAAPPKFPFEPAPVRARASVGEIANPLSSRWGAYRPGA